MSVDALGYHLPGARETTIKTTVSVATRDYPALCGPCRMEIWGYSSIHVYLVPLNWSNDEALPENPALLVKALRDEADRLSARLGIVDRIGDLDRST